jgi:prepilin-type processing-associated H-X9-DG protein
MKAKSCGGMRVLKQLEVLVIGGGIGGLTTAIALLSDGHKVTVIEKDPTWSVYGVGIIQQSNVVRAMEQLGLLGKYVEAGFGFNQVEIFLPNGERAAVIDSPSLVPGQPANIGIGRRALHKILGDSALAAGADIKLGLTVQQFDPHAAGVNVGFADGSRSSYDIVVGADGLYSATREAIFPDIASPEFTGQSVWRYNFPRADDVNNLCVYEGAVGIGLVPLSDELMYIYVTTQEDGNPRYPKDGLAAAMRSKLAGTCPRIAALADQITDNDEVVYKPLEWLLVEDHWHNGRIVLLGDAAHATTPHLGQGAGMAVEDSIVLAQEIARAETPEAAFQAYYNRRIDRCRYIVERSRAICYGQIGRGELIEQGAATFEMTQRVAQPI